MASSTSRRRSTKAAPTGPLSYTIIVRLRLRKSGGALSRATALIARAGGDTGPMDVSRSTKDFTDRDITIAVRDEAHGDDIVRRLKRVKGVEVLQVSNPVFLKHLRGKISVVPKINITTREELSEVYTPGVAQVCKAIHQSPEKAWSLTIKGNTVAVVSDGSRVLALGDIGPKAALPVMEGKAMLFKRFGDVDAFPICLDTQDTEEIIRTIKAISPVFGAINLEDIASPRCYDIERRLQAELDIPVFHDDQHATAIVVVAAAINAAKVVGKKLEDIKLVGAGVGAAGLACIKLLMAAGVKNVIGFNVTGAVHRQRTDLTEQEKWLAEHSNEACFKGTIKEALVGADMFLGLAAGGLLKGTDLKVMAKDPIVFALANPVPEVLPEDAAPYVRVMATGGSNYANQINNALVFPGVFRGALRARVPNITEEMKMAAARALAAVVTDEELDDDYIIPGAFNPKVARAVAKAVVDVAVATGTARRTPAADEI